MDDNILIVETTVPNLETAKKITAALIQKRLVGCGQISAPLHSIYTWKGAVCSDTEYRVTYKTFPQKYTAIEQAITELHPYEVPEIICFLSTNCSKTYKQWLLEVCDV